MAKVLLSYEKAANCGSRSGKWSFKVYERGTVILLKEIGSEKSSYKFKIPRDIAEQLNTYLTAYKDIIEALPKVCGGGCDGWFDSFIILGKEIDSYCLHYTNIEQSILRKTEQERRQIINEYQEVDGLLISRYYNTVIMMRNALLELFVEACSFLTPYGIIVSINERYGILSCAWCVPNHFYSHGERTPLLWYSGEHFFALYEHGTVQIEIDDSIYQLKVAHSTVDKIRAYIKAHQETAKNLDHCTDDLYKLKHHGFAIEGLAVVDYCYYSCYAEQICADNKLFIDVSRYLEPYGLEAKLEDNRVLCRWSIPYPDGEKVLLKCKGCGNSSFTIYECGAVHLVRHYSNILAPDFNYTKPQTVKTVFYLPQEIIAKLRSRILKHRDEIDILADSQLNRHNVCAYNFMGTELFISSYDLNAKLNKFLFSNQATRIFLDICKVLHPYGFTAEQSKKSYYNNKICDKDYFFNKFANRIEYYYDITFRIYQFDWGIANIPNTLFLPPEGFEAAPAECDVCDPES